MGRWMAVGTRLCILALCCGVTDGAFYKLTSEENADLQKTCGIPFQKGDPAYKVIGGREVPHGEMPWTVKLVGKHGFTCTGILISRWHMLTASHCVATDSAGDFVRSNVFESYIAHGGSPCVEDITASIQKAFHTTFAMRECEHSHIRSILLRMKAITIPQCSHAHMKVLHSKPTGYTTKDFTSDLALFQLEKPFPANDQNLRPACVVSSVLSPLPPGPMHVAGFGMSELRGAGVKELASDTELRSIQIFPDDSCNQPKAGAEMVCAPYFMASRYKTDNKTLCPGDSGSGLVATINGRSTLVGVLASVTGTCSVKDPVNSDKYKFLFTRLDKHIDFLCHFGGICPVGYTINNTLPVAIEIGSAGAKLAQGSIALSASEGSTIAAAMKQSRVGPFYAALLANIVLVRPRVLV